jgi:hypothetical protein
MEDSGRIYLVQRVYEEDPVTLGPFTGYYFTGWHRVTVYNKDDAKIEGKHFLPPGVMLDASEEGFEINQMRLATQSGTLPTTETEDHRVTHGVVLYGSDMRLGSANIRRMMRQAKLMEGVEGAGDRD